MRNDYTKVPDGCATKASHAPTATTGVCVNTDPYTGVSAYVQYPWPMRRLYKGVFRDNSALVLASSFSEALEAFSLLYGWGELKAISLEENGGI